MLKVPEENEHKIKLTWEEVELPSLDEYDPEAEGRRFLGIDNDTEHGYFEIATRRVQGAYGAA